MADPHAPPLESFDETSRALVEALRSGDPAVQEPAIEAIAEVVDDALSRELERFARDDGNDLELRARALIALGPALQMCWETEEDDGSLAPPPPDASIIEQALYDHPLSDVAYREIRNGLRRIYHDATLPKLVRRRALEAAVRAPRSWQRDAVMAAFRSGDPDWRVTAIFSMGYLGGLREGGFDEEIHEAFTADDPLARRQAILASGTAGVDRMATPLLELAVDPCAEGEDRLAAIISLAEMMPDGADDVLERITDDPDREIAEAAEAAVEEIRVFTSPEPDDLLDDLPGAPDER